MDHRALRIEVADGVALHVRTWGAGPPRMLLVHGFSHGGFVWRSLAEALVDAMPDCGLVAVDLRGHGDSDRDPGRRYGLETHVADVVVVARALDLQDVVLVGHSLGASVAILAAERLPHRPQAVVLVDGGPGLSASASAQIREEFLQLKFRYRSIDEYRDHLQTTMPLASAQVLQAMAADALQALGPAEFRLKADRALGYQVQDPSFETELWRALPRLRMPLVLVRGTASALCTKPWCDAFAARVPQAVVESVDRAGHAVMLDNPARFNAVVQRHVAQWHSPHEAPALHVGSAG
jgi:pimeloyl-ACP methyl ester carboxylesterase